jgi:hypothetical protein
VAPGPGTELCHSAIDENCDGRIDETPCALCPAVDTVALGTQTKKTKVALRAVAGMDKVLTQGTFLLPSGVAIAPDREPVTVQLTDGAGGVHYEVSIPAGRFTRSASGRAFLYRDPAAALHGLKIAKLSLRSDGVTTKYLFKAQGLDQPPFAPGTGTVTVQVGERCFVDAADLCALSPAGTAATCR